MGKLGMFPPNEEPNEERGHLSPSLFYNFNYQQGLLMVVEKLRNILKQNLTTQGLLCLKSLKFFIQIFELLSLQIHHLL